MGFLVPIAMSIGSAIAGTVGAVGSAIGAGASAIGGAIGAGATAVEGAFGFGGAAAGAAAAGDLAIPAATPIFSGILDGGAAGAGLFGGAAGAAAGATAVEGLTVTGAAAGGSLLGSFADAVVPAAIAAPIALDGSTPSIDYTQNKTSTLGGIGKDLSYASDAGSLALLAKSLMLQPPPPQVAGAPSGQSSLVSPATSGISTATFAPQLQAGVNKSISAMAAASLGGTYTGAGQASGQRKTLLGQ